MTAWVISPSPCLRFVKRDGRRILQQAWVKQYWLSGELGAPAAHEWRDVPLVDEAGPEDLGMWSERGFS